jgi:hypothetical protein
VNQLGSFWRIVTPFTCSADMGQVRARRAHAHKALGDLELEPRGVW